MLQAYADELANAEDDREVCNAIQRIIESENIEKGMHRMFAVQCSTGFSFPMRLLCSNIGMYFSSPLFCQEVS